MLFFKKCFYILIGITYFIGIKIIVKTGKVTLYNANIFMTDRLKAAEWIKNNTAENDVIATHDVGAIGYYSDRKIVDVAGLVTPELIKK